MEIGELGALLVGVVIGIFVTAIVCWLNGRSVRREPAQVEPERRMHVPVANPTPGWEPHNQPGFVASATALTPAPGPTTLTSGAFEDHTSQTLRPPTHETLASEAVKSLQVAVGQTQRERDTLAQETQNLRRQIRALNNELQRVEQRAEQASTQCKAEQHRLAVSEAGLVKARREIDEIRGFVLQLGATTSDEDIIDLRKS